MTRATGHVRKQYEEPTPWQAMKVAPLDKAALAAKKAAAAAAAGKRAKNAAANPPKKQAQAEARRIRRRRGEVCFHCRKPGHRLAECPEANATVALPERKETAHAVVCYKCGSPDHTAKQCAKRDGGFAFAVCFVCKEQGHLSGQCPKNEHGLYPNGGGCKYCGSVNHYARDCRPTQPGAERAPPLVAAPRLPSTELTMACCNGRTRVCHRGQARRASRSAGCARTRTRKRTTRSRSSGASMPTAGPARASVLQPQPTRRRPTRPHRRRGPPPSPRRPGPRGPRSSSFNVRHLVLP